MELKECFDVVDFEKNNLIYEENLNKNLNIEISLYEWMNEKKRREMIIIK